MKANIAFEKKTNSAFEEKMDRYEVRRLKIMSSAFVVTKNDLSASKIFRLFDVFILRLIYERQKLIYYTVD